MKNRSQRGAARVSAVWMIVAFVLVFVALAFGYISQQEAATAVATRDRALSDRDQSDAKFEAEIAKTREVSDVLGYKPEGVIGGTSNVSAATQGLESLKAAFPDMDATIGTFETAVPVVVAQYNAKVREIGTLQNQIGDLSNQVQAVRQQVTQVGQEKDQTIADLRSQLSDANANARDTQESLQSRLDAASSDRNEKDSQLRSVRGELDDVTRALEREKQAATTRFRQLSDKLRFLDEPESPDGEVLAVSDSLPLGFINRGTLDRVQRGMVFRVVSGRPGADTVKGYAEVTRVESRRSEVTFYDLADPFDPISAGDIVYNPLYDPEGERNAVLAGRFTGTFTESDIKLLAKQIGINIQPRVTDDTDYLILGGEIFLDEDGEPLEEPIQPTDLEAYKEAEARGAAIISYRDLQRFFKR